MFDQFRAANQKMRYFTLRVFEPVDPARIWALTVLKETRIAALTAEEGKRQLTDLINRRVLERERFYRFEGFAPSSAGGPQFVFDIAFYLFADGRLCPVRIWHRTEQASNQTDDSDWLVDFNGIPGWSRFASIEPRWRMLSSSVLSNTSHDPQIGRSHRDWYKRRCWSLTPSSASSLPNAPPFSAQEIYSLKVAC